MYNFESEGDDGFPVCTLVKTVIFIVIAAFVFILPLGDPCEKMDSAQNNNKVVYHTCKAYSLAVKAANKAMEKLKCMLRVLFQPMCESKVEKKPFFKHANVKKTASDVPAKPNQDVPAIPNQDVPAEPNQDIPAKPNQDEPVNSNKNVPAKPKKDRFAMLKFKKDKKSGPSKTDSCSNCIEKGQVCSKSCSKTNVKDK